jgi:carboxyl-terminal processing protease
MLSKTQTLSKSIQLLIALLLLVIAFSIGLFLGRQQQARFSVPEGEGQITNRTSGEETIAEDIDFENFWDIWNFVKEEFYLQPVSDEDLYQGAIKGMVEGLGDDYSLYFTPEETEQFLDGLEGQFEGIGCEIGMKDDQLQVVAPLPETPADLAGLLPGDFIMSIDDVSTDNLSLEEAVTYIRGEKGTEVVLSIYRPGTQDFFDASIVRDTITIDSVVWEMRDDQIMVIGLYSFNTETAELFEKAVQEALVEGVDGIVLDLRSNPGGLLTSAIDIASYWAGYQTILIEKSVDDTQTFLGTLDARLSDIPTVVLVNNGSASGSEIVAGTLQDYDLGTIIGMQTYGKGSVQDFVELRDGSAIKITIAQWYTPNGRSIQEKGISPDIEVDYTIEDFQEGTDPQLDAAITTIIYGEEEAIALFAQEESESEI